VIFSGGKVLKRVLFTVGLIAFILIVSIWWTINLKINIFQETRWISIAAFVVGIIVGTIGARIKQSRRARTVNKPPERHTFDSIIEHWGTAIGLFIMIVSGYQIHEHGGLNAIKLHFLGLFLTLLFGSYFLADFFASRKYVELFPNIKDIVDGTIKKYILRLKPKEAGKYLSSQKSSFLVFFILGGLIFVSGVIKLIPFYTPISFRIIKIATTIHDVSAWGFVAILAIHILWVIIWPSYRPLLGSWFTGKTPQESQSQGNKLANSATEDVEINKPKI
jgi:cytochrome b subunit of formate dehydrogenase